MEKDFIEEFSSLLDTFEESFSKIDEMTNTISNINESLKQFSNITIPEPPNIEKQEPIHKDINTFFKSLIGVNERVGKAVKKQLDPFFSLYEKFGEWDITGQQVDIPPIRDIVRPALQEIGAIGKLYARKFKPEQDLFINLEDLPFGEHNILFKDDVANINRTLRTLTRPFRSFRNIFTSLHEMVLPREAYVGDVQNIRKQLDNVVKNFGQNYQKIRKEIADKVSKDLLAQHEVSTPEELREVYGEQAFKDYQEAIADTISRIDDIVNKRFEKSQRYRNVIENVLSRIEKGESPMEAYINETSSLMKDIFTGMTASGWEKNKRFFERIGITQEKFFELYGRNTEQFISSLEDQFRKTTQYDFLTKATTPFIQAEGPIVGTYYTFEQLPNVRKAVDEDVVRKFLAQNAKQVLNNINEYSRGIEKLIMETFDPNKMFGGALEMISSLAGISESGKELYSTGMMFEVGYRTFDQQINELLSKQKENLVQKIKDFREIKQELGKQLQTHGIDIDINKPLQEVVSTLEQSGKLFELPQNLQAGLISGAAEEQVLLRERLQFALKESGIGEPEILHKQLLENYKNIEGIIGNLEKNLFMRVGKTMIPMFNLSLDMGMMPSIEPDLTTKITDKIRPLLGAEGFSADWFRMFSEEIRESIAQLHAPEIYKQLREVTQQQIRRLKTIINTTNKILSGEGLESIFKNLVSDKEFGIEKELRERFGIPEKEPLTLERISKERFTGFLEETLQIEGLSNIFEGTREVTDKQKSALKELNQQYTRQLSQLETRFRELSTGVPTIGSTVQTTVRGIKDSLSMFTRFMGQMGSWVMGMPVMSGMWMTSYQPVMVAQETAMPLMYGVGGITGVPMFYQQLLGFAFNLPNIMTQVQEQFITMATLMRSRTAAQTALSGAMEIARWQPIQFEEALQTITAFTIFPETRAQIRQPEFQQQAMETVQLLSMLVPEQGIEGAVFAIRELLGNQFRSLERRFNISRELIASFADMSLEQFKDLPGPEKIATLHKALSAMFAGGEEILLQRGMMFDIQIQNFMDTLVRTVIPPLTIEKQPRARQYIEQLSISPTGKRDYSIYEMILGPTWKKYMSLAERQRERSPELRERYTTEEIAASMMLSQASTISGMLSVMFSGINNLFSTAINQAGIGNILVGFLERVTAPIMGQGGFIQRWSYRLRGMEGVQISDERGKEVLIEFIQDLVKSVGVGIDEFKTIIDDSRIKMIFGDIGDKIMQGMMVTMETVMRQATIAGAKVTLMFPKVFGETIIEGTNQVLAGIIDKSKRGEGLNILSGTFDIAGTISMIRGFGLFMSNAPLIRAGGWLATGMGIGMLPEIPKYVREGQFLNVAEVLGLTFAPALTNVLQNQLSRIRPVLSIQGLTQQVGRYGYLAPMAAGGIDLMNAIRAIRDPNQEQFRTDNIIRAISDGFTLATSYMAMRGRMSPAWIGLSILPSVGANLSRAIQTNDSALRREAIGSALQQSLLSMAGILAMSGVGAPWALGIATAGLLAPYAVDFIMKEPEKKKDETETYTRDLTTKMIETNINRTILNYTDSLALMFKDFANRFGLKGTTKIPEETIKERYTELVRERFTERFTQDETFRRQLRGHNLVTFNEILSGRIEQIDEFLKNIGLTRKEMKLPTYEEFRIQEQQKIYRTEYETFGEQIGKVEMLPLKRLNEYFNKMKDDLEKSGIDMERLMSDERFGGDLKQRLSHMVKLRAQLLKQGVDENTISRLETMAYSGDTSGKELTDVINEVVGDLPRTTREMLLNYINNIVSFKQETMKVMKDVFGKDFTTESVDAVMVTLFENKGGISDISNEYLSKAQDLQVKLNEALKKNMTNLLLQPQLEAFIPPTMPEFPNIMEGNFQEQLRGFQQQLINYSSQARQFLNNTMKLLSPQMFGAYMMLGGLAEGAGIEFQGMSPTQFAMQNFMKLNRAILEKPELLAQAGGDFLQRPMLYMGMLTFGRIQAEKEYGPEKADQMYKTAVETLFKSASAYYLTPATGDISKALGTIGEINVGSGNISVGNATVIIGGTSQVKIGS